MLKQLKAGFLSLTLSLIPVAAFALPPGSEPNMVTTQVTCASTATLLASGNAQKSFVTIVNTTTTNVYYGNSASVTTSNGALLPGVVGASINFAYTGPMYCIVGTGSAVVTKTDIQAN